MIRIRRETRFDENGEQWANIKPGDKIVTAEQQERNRRYKEMREQEEMKKTLERIKEREKEQWRNDNPKFYYMYSGKRYNDLSPATAARLAYLATFTSYNGQLIFPNHKPMKRRDLPQIMELPHSVVSNFIKEVKGKYLICTDEKRLYMPQDLVCRGTLKKDGRYQRIYIDSVRTLYHLTPPRRHGLLGYLFQMLPFVNEETNVLCRDIFEPDLELSKPLTINEFCSEIGFDTAHRDKLPKLYENITLMVGGREERFVSFVTNGVNLDSAIIYVNPHILYHGNDAEKVELLGQFCVVRGVEIYRKFTK